VRQSLLIAAAKARVWASEGWEVVVTDGEERTLDPADFEKLFELTMVKPMAYKKCHGRRSGTALAV
jgi:hypothetical protein